MARRGGVAGASFTTLLLAYACVSPVQVPQPEWDENDRTVLTVIDGGASTVAVLGGPSLGFSYARTKSEALFAQSMSWSCDSPGQLGLSVDRSAKLIPSVTRHPDRIFSLQAAAGADEVLWQSSESLDLELLARAGVEIRKEGYCTSLAAEFVEEPIPVDEVAFALTLRSGNALVGSPGLGAFTIDAIEGSAPLRIDGVSDFRPMAAFETRAGVLYLYGMGGALIRGAAGGGPFEVLPSNPGWVDCRPDEEEGRRIGLSGSPDGDELILASDDGGLAWFDVEAGSWTPIRRPEPLGELGECPHPGASVVWTDRGTAIYALAGIVGAHPVTRTSSSGSTLVPRELVTSLLAIDGPLPREVLIGTDLGHLYRRSRTGTVEVWYEETLPFNDVRAIVPAESGFIVMFGSILTRVVVRDGKVARCEEPISSGNPPARLVVGLGEGLLFTPYFDTESRARMQRLRPRERGPCEVPGRLVE
ncbi:MAG: hypothetical protein HYV07_01295 [Deltaproteobacteria bacterium]|nr:hypothetical protein [Deltaproteobacteria bacterium]